MVGGLEELFEVGDALVVVSVGATLGVMIVVEFGVVSVVLVVLELERPKLELFVLVLVVLMLGGLGVEVTLGRIEVVVFTKTLVELCLEGTVVVVFEATADVVLGTLLEFALMLEFEITSVVRVGVMERVVELVVCVVLDTVLLVPPVVLSGDALDPIVEPEDSIHVQFFLEETLVVASIGDLTQEPEDSGTDDEHGSRSDP